VRLKIWSLETAAHRTRRNLGLCSTGTDKA